MTDPERGAPSPARAGATAMTLALAERMAEAVLAGARSRGMDPVALVVLDAGGHLVLAKREDGCPFLIAKVAHGKAYGAIALGRPSSVLAQFGVAVPNLIPALVGAADGPLVAAAGGVLIRDAAGTLLGSLGVSGGAAEDDEAIAIAAVRVAGKVPEPDR